MSIDALIDSVVKCLLCGAPGIMKCGCWRECECGRWIAKDEQCRDRAHGPDGQRYLKEGYWIIDPNTGRPYKTGTGSLGIIGERMRRGTLWGSRKEANSAVRAMGKKP